MNRMTRIWQVFRYSVIDTWVVIKRNALRTARLPQLLFFSSVQPVLFLLLFYYVFGGAVFGGGGKYINFLLPAILIQTVLFGAIQTGMGLAEDTQRGVIDRFRSLPMSRIAHMAGRIFADSVRNILVIGLMIVVGLTLGFSFSNGVGMAIASIFLALFFGLAFSWIAALVGLITKDSETAQVIGFLWTFPLIFASSGFVPVATMPGWLQAFANNQPVSQAIDAMRALTQGGAMGGVWKAVVWTVAIMAIVVPLAVYKYRRSS